MLFRSLPDATTMDLSLDANRFNVSATLTEFQSVQDTNRFDPWSLTLRASNMFGGEQQVFSYCDAFPTSYEYVRDSCGILIPAEADGEVLEIAEQDIPINIYSRREIFARSFLRSIKHRLRANPDTGQEEWSTEMQDNPGRPYARFNRADIDERLENFLEDNDLRNHIYHNLYPKFLEGIFEQIFYSLKNSRIYDQQNYYPNLSARVAGRSFQTPEGCFTNRFNVSQFGILSFEKIVTDELSKQITGQLADPENSPYNLDYDDLGPIEKAIQNVCIIGFVRKIGRAHV